MDDDDEVDADVDDDNDGDDDCDDVKDGDHDDANSEPQSALGKHTYGVMEKVSD